MRMVLLGVCRRRLLRSAIVWLLVGCVAVNGLPATTLQSAAAASRQLPTPQPLPAGAKPLPDATIRQADLELEAELKREAALIDGERIGTDGAPVSLPVELGLVLTRDLWVAMLRQRAADLETLKGLSREEKLAILDELRSAAPALQSAYEDMIAAEGAALHPTRHEKARYEQLLEDVKTHEGARNTAAAEQARDRAARSPWKFYIDRRQKFFDLLEKDATAGLLGLYSDNWWMANKYLFQTLMHTRFSLDATTSQEEVLTIFDSFLDDGIGRLRKAADDAEAIDEFSELLEFASPKYARVHQMAVLISDASGMTAPALFVYPLADVGQSFALAEQFGDIVREILVTFVCLATLPLPVVGAIVNSGVAMFEVINEGGRLVVQWSNTTEARLTASVTGQQHVITETEKANARAGRLIFAFIGAGMTLPFLKNAIREGKVASAARPKPATTGGGTPAAVDASPADMPWVQRGAKRAAALGIPQDQIDAYLRSAVRNDANARVFAKALAQVGELDELRAAALAAGVTQNEIDAMFAAAMASKSLRVLATDLPVNLLRATFNKRGIKVVVDWPWKGVSNVTDDVVADVPGEALLTFFGNNLPANTLRADLVSVFNLRSKLEFMRGGFPVTWSAAELESLQHLMRRTDLSSMYAFISDERVFIKLIDDDLIDVGRRFLASPNRSNIANGRELLPPITGAPPAAPSASAGGTAALPILAGAAATRALGQLIGDRQVGERSGSTDPFEPLSKPVSSGANAADAANSGAGPVSRTALEQAAVDRARERFGRGTAQWTTIQLSNGGVAVASLDGMRTVVATTGDDGRVNIEVMTRRGRFIDHERVFRGVFLQWSTPIAGASGGPFATPSVPAKPKEATSIGPPIGGVLNPTGSVHEGAASVTSVGSANVFERKIRTTNIRANSATGISFVDHTNAAFPIWVGSNATSAFNPTLVSGAATLDDTQLVIARRKRVARQGRASPGWRDLLIGPIAPVLARRLPSMYGHDVHSTARMAVGSLGSRLAAVSPLHTGKTAQESRGPGLSVFVTSLGTIAGDAFRMVVVNDKGTPYELVDEPFVLEPIARVTQTQIERELQRLRTQQQVATILEGYCLDMSKPPPAAGMVFRIANRATQERFARIGPVLEASKSLIEQGVLRGGSGESYLHAVRQWATWALQEKFDEASFGRAFLGHSRRNLEAAGRPWTREIEAALRQMVPIRWTDVAQVLALASQRGAR